MRFPIASMRLPRALARPVAWLVLLAGAALLPTRPAGAFVTFESGQVRPLAMSPDGTLLFACNTPDNRLEVFDVTDTGLTQVASVPVGLEPVAVAARSNTEVWVVNHLSDSVSVVDLSDLSAPRVTRSLLVGDEPRDIVFGGTSFDRAFITTAHRGQNIGFDPELSTPGVGRADVWVFDAGNLGSSFGGEALTVVTLFGDTPRPLAVSADGSRVYAGVFFSGNQTTVIPEGLVPDGGPAFGGLPNPRTNYAGIPAPEVSLIVKWDGTKWTDELGRNWSSKVKFSLPDYDVFAIDATANPPAQVAGAAGRIAHVGTTLFNMALNPADGKLFVSNLEAFNEVRFEGPAIFADTSVRGHLVESSISVVDPATQSVVRRNLNKHIDYASSYAPVPNPTSEKSLAFPLDMAFTADGSKMYVAAFGSGKVGTFVPSQIEDGSFVPDSADHIEVSGGGPSGLVLDEARSRLYVLTRFDNSVSVVNTAIGAEVDHIALHNPEPASVVQGRPFLYDARYTSARGDQACASCHVFGDFDALAWDLGNPDDDMLNNPSPFLIGPFGDPDFHPMKGPMTTQSLRGMDNHGPMHWRGDRTGGNDVPSSAQPNTGIYNEQAAFKKFNPAFVGLLGRSDELTPAEMQKFTDFILQVMYPPNPVRNLDDSLTADQQVASNIYFNRQIDTLRKCNGCHVHNRDGNKAAGVPRPGFFGTDGRSSFEGETQHLKIAHTRNMYQKVGMFGSAANPFLNPGDNGFKGDQVRGFGFVHDGSVDTLFRFFQALVFNHQDGPVPNDGFHNDTERRQMESLMLAFDSNHRPIVGQQVTLTSTSGADADARIDLLLARAEVGDCDVVVKGTIAGEERGAVYAGAGNFRTDKVSDGPVSDATMRSFAAMPGQDLTFTAVPVGEGERMGIDRDLDGFRDADESASGGNPADAGSSPCAVNTTGVVFRKAGVEDARGRLQVQADVTLTAPYAGQTLHVDAWDNGGEFFTASLLQGGLVVNSSVTQWKYKAPKGTTGITQATIKSLGSNQYRVTLKTDQAWAPPAAGETPATTGVRVQLYDECFEGKATSVK